MWSGWVQLKFVVVIVVAVRCGGGRIFQGLVDDVWGEGGDSFKSTQTQRRGLKCSITANTLGQHSVGLSHRGVLNGGRLVFLTVTWHP